MNQMTENSNILGRVLRVLLYWVTAIALVIIPTFVHAQPPIQPTAADTPTLFLPSVITKSDAEQSPEETPEPGDRLSAEERMMIVESVETRVNELLPPVGTPIEERNFLDEVDQLGDELLTIPGVLATFVSTPTLTVQVVMEDGLSISIVNNRPVEPPLSPEAAQIAAEHFVAQNVAPHAVPGSKRAVVANFDGGDAVAAAVRAILSDAGYEVLGLGASLSDMQNYTNLGMLYLDTHGVQYQHFSIEPGSQTLSSGHFVYGLQTSTQVRLSTMESYSSLLNNGEVVLSLGEEETGRTVKFAITEKFIANYWSFDKAITIIHSCYGGAAPFKPGATCKGGRCFSPGDPGVLDPSALRTAMLARGADAVISFDSLTNPDYARPSILFLLDRLLGSNDVQPVGNPPLRPFPLDEVRAEMGRQNLLSFHKPNSTLFGFEFGGNTVNLTFDTRDAKAGLVPTIERVTVLDDPIQAEGELDIKGNFSTEQGTVTISGVPATIKSWNATSIVVNTPFNGQGAAGELIVQGPGQIESNAVPLTLWRGIFELQYIPGQGSLEAAANLDLHFRADLHKSRQTLNGTPIVDSQEVYLYAHEGSRVIASGIYVDPDDGHTMTYSGGSAIHEMSSHLVDMLAQLGAQSAANRPAQELEDGIAGGLVTLDPARGRARFCLTSQGGYHEIHGSGGGVSIPFMGMLVLTPGLADSTWGLLACFDTTLRGNYTIAGGERTVQLGEGARFRVKWSEFAPVAPPTDETPG
ncbi:MAG: hypothetical protein IT328_20715 [Caldilineaceae bacterium]|nr:hypothetical protein [Caldilineaceae bacterium]